MFWFKGDFLVQGISSGLSFLVIWKCSDPGGVLVQSRCSGSREMFWFKVDVLVQSRCSGSREMFWFKVDVLIQGRCSGSK